ncbi:MAG: BtpA/SgcQ family protein, partial [Petrotogales bacterium]
MNGQVNALNQIFSVKKPIIGMIHLKPLPGSPLYDPKGMPMAEIIKNAVDEAKILEDAGIDGLQVENIWDFPYLKNKDIPNETVSSLSVATYEIKKSVDIPVGVNCHLNGGCAAFAAAVAAGANWIRVFEWVNAYIS